jgi:CMP-N-acetylneuraminic acid synthetase
VPVGVSDTSVAVIPARGGSRGIPRKNLLEVGGVPLVVRAIRACTLSRRLDQVVVSTDDPAIAELARAEGATVVMRPAELATDTATSESAVRHALDELREYGWDYPARTLLVQCTSPFIASADLDRLVETLSSGDADSCFLAAPSHRFLWRIDARGAARPVNHDMDHRRPRQELEPEFVETGAAYGFRTEGFLSANSRFFGRVVLVEVDADGALEIDEPADLEAARRQASGGESTAPMALPGTDRAEIGASDR